MSFSDFELDSCLLTALQGQGFIEPTPIQKEAIPPALLGQDVLGLAQTGTGKTAAFALPMIQRILSSGLRGGVQGLVVAPTRELAKQIVEDIMVLARRSRLNSMAIYGGVGMHGQVMQLRTGPEILVACPGRLLDHVRQGNIDLSSVNVVVLDEADMMFDMGFLDDVRELLRLTCQRSQTLLFSATMPGAIRSLADEILQEPAVIEIAAPTPVETVAHDLYPVAPHLKVPLLKLLLRTTTFESLIVFTRTRYGAQRLWRQLTNAGFEATCLQGKLTQRVRQAALDGFRRGKYPILVATDIAARGLDITRVSHVINYDFPPSVEAYIHRIGRTGRAWRSGLALTLVTPEDESMVRTLERAIGDTLTRCHLEMFDYGAAERHGDAKPARPRLSPRPKRLPKGLKPRKLEREDTPVSRAVLDAPARILYTPDTDDKREPKPASRTIHKTPPSPRMPRKGVRKGEES